MVPNSLYLNSESGNHNSLCTRRILYAPTTRFSRTRVFVAVDAQKADCWIYIHLNENGISLYRV